MDFGICKTAHFSVTHCYDCVVPGYLIVSPAVPVISLAALSREALEELGPLLAVSVEAIRKVVAPQKIYCAQFGEESPHLHFHLFPRTLAITDEFLRAFPEQRDLIHEPVLLDWARSRHRAERSMVGSGVQAVIGALRTELRLSVEAPFSDKAPKVQS